MSQSLKEKKLEAKRKMVTLKMRQLEQQKANQEPESRPWYDVTAEGLKESVVSQLPELGGTVGAGLGFISPVPGGLLMGAGAGSYLGKAAQNLARSAEGEEVTRKDIYLEPFKSAAEGMAFEGAAGLIGKGLKAGVKGIRGGRKGVGETIEMYGQEAPIGTELEKAGERLGIEPSRGMLTGSQEVANMEQAIAQGTSKSAERMRKQLEAIPKGLQKSMGDIFEPGPQAPTKIQQAQTAKSDIVAGIGEKLDPAVSVYQKIEKELPQIPLNFKSQERIAKNISKLPYAKFKGEKASSFANNMINNLMNAKNLEDLRNIKSYAGEIARDMNQPATMRKTAGDIFGKLQRLEQNSITRAAIDNAKNAQHGQRIAREFIGELRDANKIYAQVSNDLKNLAKKTGMGKVRNYSDFIRKLEDIPDEKLTSKLFQPENTAALAELKNQFPNAFEAMKQAYMGDFYVKNIGADQEILLGSMLKKINKMNPEFRQVVFGPDANQTLKDIQLVFNEMPEILNPSKTSRGIEYMKFELMNPTSWWQSLKGRSNEYLMANPDLLRKMGRTIKPSPIAEDFAPRALRGKMPQPQPSYYERLTMPGLMGRGLMQQGQGMLTDE